MNRIVSVLHVNAKHGSGQFMQTFHKARIALFLSGMRHFRDALREAGHAVDYVSLNDSDEPALPGRLAQQLQRSRPDVLRLLEPGEWRLQQGITATAHDAGVTLQWLDDTHFLCSRADFARWASPYRGSLRMEYFYREMRRRYRRAARSRGDDTRPARGWPMEL